MVSHAEQAMTPKMGAADGPEAPRKGYKGIFNAAK